jgi:glycosyltransferase involved in cell wall biosynthesis
VVPIPSNASNGPVDISVVVPLFNEEENVRAMHRRLTQTLRPMGLAYELVFVDDGSRDDTPVLLDELRRADANVLVVELSRNFGHQAAISAGIDHARGQAVILMDGDLQDPPEVLPQFIARWRQGFDVVYAVRRNRKENLLKRAGYFLFYRLLRSISNLDIPLDSGDFCLMDRRVVEVLKHLPERMRFVRGLRTFVGFRQCGLWYERAARESGKPKYTLRGLVRLAMDGLINFSTYPLNLVTYLGFFSAALAAGLIIWALTGALLDNTPPGWASLILVSLFLGAMQLFSLGIIGEYIRRIFVETKGRPTYIVREARQGPDRQDADAAPFESYTVPAENVEAPLF